MAKFITNAHEVRVPTLLIGIGGIGGRIVSGVYDQLNDFDKDYVEMLVLDTNVNDLSELEEKGITVVQTSENRTVQDYLVNNQQYLEWFPVNPLINSKNLIDGAGQIRSVSRLGGLAAEEKFKAINDAVYKLKKNRGDSLTKAVKVMIVGSITGGTGSGLGVQLPFYIRDVISKEGSSPDILIRGLFLCPDITTKVQQTKNNEDAMYVNGYAFIRELNAFYKAQGLRDDEINISVEHYEKGAHNQGLIEELHSANQIPYNFMFLLESSTNNGTNLGGLAAYELQASKIVKNQLFSKVSGPQFSAEDNLIIGSIESQGMNRYCGAGYAAVKYPKDDMEKYCTLKYSDTLIKDFWLYFDKKYEEDCKIQKMNMAHNPTLKPLQRDEHYLRVFNEKTKDINSPAEIAILRSDIEGIRTDLQTGLEIREKKSSTISKAIKKLILNALEDARENSGFNEEMFQMNSASIKDPSTAEGDVRRVLNALSQYYNKTREAVSNLSADCAGKILPFSLLTANSEGDAEFNLYSQLKNMHPLSVRYVLYELYDMLTEDKSNADSWLAENLDSVIKQDYNDKLDGNQSAPESVGRYATIKFSEKISNLFTGGYSDLLGEIQEDISGELNRIDEYRENKLKSTVYSIVLGGIEKLIKIYEGFFDGLKTVLDNNTREISKIEDMKDYIFNGERYICADGACKKQVFQEIYDNATGEMMMLSTEVKQALFDRLFEEYVALAQKKDSLSSHDDSELKNAAKIYDDCIFPSLKAEVKKFGDAIIDMSIFEAIDKHYTIHANIAKQDEIENEYTKLSMSQFRTTVFESVANLAEPYLYYKNATASRIVAYWGANESAVKLNQNVTKGNYDSTKLLEMFGNPGDATYADVVDSSFSPYEVVCYKAIYSLTVENLQKFAKNSTCYVKYMERLDAVIEKSAVISQEASGYLTTVHPHLDKRWHNRAYLPLLNEQEDKNEGKNDILAFVIGIGLGIFRYMEYDYLDSWCCVTDDDVFPIIMDGKKIRTNSYTELYKSINYNKVIKDGILAEEETLKKSAKDSVNLVDANGDMLDFYYKLLINHKLIKMLIGNSESTNILDIVCDIYNAAGNIPLVADLLSFIKSYILDYCMIMTNKQEGLSGKLTEKLLNEIKLNSKKLETVSESMKLKIDINLFRSNSVDA